MGETIAPRTNDIAQGKSISSCAITATTAAVTITSPIALSEITRASVRKARRSAKKAAE